MRAKIALLLTVLAALLALPVAAQSPVDYAQATISAATSQARADDWYAQQQATRAAQSLSATTDAQHVQAIATKDAQAAQAQATAQALDADATATVQANAAQLAAMQTAQAMQAQATARAVEQSQAARATVATGDALATRMVYDVQVNEIRKRSELGTLMLYASGGAAALWMLAAVAAWVRRRVSDAAIVAQNDISATQVTPAGAVIIDYTPQWVAMGADMPPVSAMPPGQAAVVGQRLDEMLEGQA